jgi:hypothetical protein
VWISGLLALIGALAGVLLSSYLTRSSQRKDARRGRFEAALRAVTLAISARHFATRAGFVGKPPSVKEGDIEELTRRIYL